MASEAAIPRYSAISVWLHWSTVVAVFSAFGLVWAVEMLDLESVEKQIVFLHKSFGLLVLVLTLLRVVVKLSGRAGTPALRPSPLFDRMAVLGHVGLYGFMLAVPVIGWLKASAGDKAISLFGIPLPALVAKNRDLADTFGELHEIAAYIFLGMIALHVIAALWHGFFRKDGVMYSMLPVARWLPKR